LNKNITGVTASNSADLYIERQVKMDWQKKYLLIIDEMNIFNV